MATAANRTKIDELKQEMSLRVQHEPNCSRCGGLLVGDLSIDGLNSTGELDFAAERCVQCGEVIDPIILKNRRLQQASLTGSLFLAAVLLAAGCATDFSQ
jgi:hypothetical protein